MTERKTPPVTRLSGRTAVVTGASSGIGRAIALRLVTEGVSVVAVGRDEARLAALPVNAVGPGTIEAVQLDLTNDAARYAFANSITEGRGRLDVIVHSAGVYHYGLVDKARLNDFDAQYAANLRAPFALTQRLLPALRAAGREHGADIVVINSSQGIRAGGGTSQYAAVQHGMRAVADSLRLELNVDGIRVCSVHLGRTATPRQDAIYAREGRAYRPALLVQPDDVADLVVAVLRLQMTAEITEIHMRPAQKSY